MIRFGPSFLAALLAAGALLGTAWQDARAGEGLTVVELFTSQGCNSCPPADTYMVELVQRPGLLGLTFHVDYWDYLGWKDTFATAEGTERQRAYRKALGKGYVYTPQMVIDGTSDAVGSHREDVEREIGRAARARGPVAPVELVPVGEQVVARIGAGEIDGEATVWLVRFDRRHSIDVRRGENAGETLTYYNVVRDVTRVGSWRGEAKDIPLASARVLGMGGRDACAVIVQRDGNGPILGAATISLDTIN